MSSEARSRFFMIQLISACHYMHTHQVIHRDLKLSNLFLDADMNITKTEETTCGSRTILCRGIVRYGKRTQFRPSRLTPDPLVLS
ncbi:hypothetical protein DFH94DRAFT_700602 [Russula ochroleuca]|uniref:Protein kinase domain-containing protein n=1 Tax=Russula ochroleuca TaxID=152965 RepID=A0A9P5TE53_9AGAM|nr:hypothetical protein DFH94DRAFT_700602 [Russula ochroleuca]